MNASVPRDPNLTARLARAREFVDEGRDADAAALLEQAPSPETDRLHREIATRCATRALQHQELAAAKAWLERGLLRSADDPMLNFFYGNLLLDAGHPPEAIDSFRRCVTADPLREEFACNLAHALLSTAHYTEAVAVLTPFAASSAAQLNLGAAREGLGDCAGAIAAYERAAGLRPDLSEAWLNLGRLRARLGDLAAALAALNRAVALRPTDAAAHLERAHVLVRRQNLADAAVSFERAVHFDPDNLAARLSLAHTRQLLCDWRSGLDARAELVRPILAAAESGRSFDPFALLALPGAIQPTELRQVAECRSRRASAGATPLRDRAELSAGRPLRIGYLSPDFGRHAVGDCVRSLFAHHDRSRVTVHGFALGVSSNDEYGTIRTGCDTWDELPAGAERAAAERIAAHGIDILVDLAGHTLNNGLRILAWRPAPIQLTWLGYPGTTGASFIDGLLADAIVLPPGEEAAFSETIIRLPGCYLPVDDRQPIAEEPQPRSAHGLPESGAVLYAFNNGFKIEPLVFRAWMEILRRVDGAVLWLRGGPASLEANLQRAAMAHGIDPARLVFDRRALPKAQHLARHRAADLFLDTHFYNAHTTAAEALRAGLPVLTCPGPTFPGRVGASLLHALGLADELVAHSLDDYIERAVRIAGDADWRKAISARLDRARSESDLFQTAAFARKLEEAFHAVSSQRTATKRIAHR